MLVSRWGSRVVSPASTAAIAANLVLLALAPSWAVLALGLFVAGSLDAIADVANNAHGLRVERRYGRSVLNSMHAVWSIGAVCGAGMGSLAVGLGLPVTVHLPAAALLIAVVPLVARRHLLPGHDAEERPPVPPPHAGGPALRQRSGPVPRRLVGSLAALGVIAASSQAIEDVGATWSAVYLREELGAAAAVGGLGFIALQTCQTVGRLLGDRAVTRFGDRTVARVGAGVGGCAMAAALAAPTPAGVVLAFGVLGLGIGTLIPASLRRADALPGLPAGTGLTVVGTIDRIAIFAAPPVIGAVADATSLRVGFLVLPLAAALVVGLAGALPRRVVSTASR